MFLFGNINWLIESTLDFSTYTQVSGKYSQNIFGES